MGTCQEKAKSPLGIMKMRKICRLCKTTVQDYITRDIYCNVSIYNCGHKTLLGEGWQYMEVYKSNVFYTWIKCKLSGRHFLKTHSSLFTSCLLTTYWVKQSPIHCIFRIPVLHDYQNIDTKIGSSYFLSFSVCKFQSTVFVLHKKKQKNCFKEVFCSG